MSDDSEKPNIIGNWTKYCTVAKSVGRGRPIWTSVVVRARASLALCGRFNQFRSPYSWITMRRALRKQRVFDFVPSYLKVSIGRKNGGYSQNGRNLGGFPCREGPAGQLLRSAWSAASGQALLSGFFSSSCRQKSLILTKIFPAWHLLLVTMLIFAFTGLRYRILKGLREPASVGNLWRSSRGALAQVFRKDRTDFDARSDTTIARVQVCLQPPGRLFFVKFDSRTMETEHQLQFPMSMWLSPLYIL